MRLVYFSSSIIPSTLANSVHVMRMANAFSEIGNSVNLIAVKPDLNIEKNPNEYYGINNNFKIEYCNRTGSTRIGSLIFGIRAALMAHNFFADLMYGRCPHSLFFARLNGRPFIYEVHDIPGNFMRKLLENFLFHSYNFRKLVVISDALKSAYLKLFPNLKFSDIIVAHDGADVPDNVNHNSIGYFNIRSIPARKREIGYIGSLYEGKGAEIIPELAIIRPEYNFNIVGGSQKEINVLSRKSPKNVKFYGRVNPSNVFKIMRSFDILLLPAQQKVETQLGGNIAPYMSPLKMFEYMSSGRPIIASRLPVLLEVLKHEENALIVDPTDINGWVEGIDRIFNDIDLEIFISKNAFKDLQNLYSWKGRAQNIIDASS
jgi:glycosyltransferase involved in cell wall biosynthesis